MPRSKKFTSDSRDALEILRTAFIDVKTPRAAELVTRKKRTYTIASDPYREPVPEDVPAKISKKLAVERQTRGRQPTIAESQDIPPPFWTETPEPEKHAVKAEPSKESNPLENWENEGGATPQERLETIEEQTKTLPPKDRKEFEELTAQIKAQFEPQDQKEKGTEAPQQVKQSAPPLQPPQQFAKKPQPDEMNEHVIPEGLARSAIAMGLKNKQTPNKDELNRQGSEGNILPPEKAPDLGVVEAQLKETLAKVHDETKVLTQEEVDAILASAPKEDQSKTTEDEDKKTEADHKVHMRSPQSLSLEKLPEPVAPFETPIKEEKKQTPEEKEKIERSTQKAYQYAVEPNVLNPEDLPKKSVPAEVPPEIKKRREETAKEYAARRFHAGDTAVWHTVGPKGVEEYNVLVQGITKDAKGKEQAVVELPDGKEITLSFSELFKEYRQEKILKLEEERESLWKTISDEKGTGGSEKEKERHVALRLAQAYEYSVAAIEEKLKKIDPGMQMAQEQLQAAKKLIQTEIDTSSAPQPPENLPIQDTTEKAPSPEKFLFPIGKTGPDGAITKFFAKNPEIAKQYGWDGTSDIKKWFRDPTPEKGGWWHARRILKEALKSPEIKKQMKDLGYLKGLSKQECDNEESLVGRYWDMMRRVEKKSALGIAPDASSLDFSSVQFKKAPRYI